MRRVRLLLWGLVAIAAIAFLYLQSRPAADGLPPARSTDLPLAGIGGPFTLTGSDGQPFSSASLAGKPYALFFGFTHCPDVCPTTLARLTKLRRELGRGEDAFAIVFVTVDPERDGPAEVGRYAALFATPVIGLTGSPAAIDRVKDQFGVFSQRTPLPGGDYSVDHTASVFLVDENGRFQSTIALDEGDPAALAKLKRLVG